MAEDADNRPAGGPPGPEPRPYWRRSILWDYEDAIRKRIAEKKSYPQIHHALRLSGKVSVRRLAQFCTEQLGIHSLRPSRHDRTRSSAAKKDAPAAPSPPPAASRSVLAEALGPEPGDEWAEFRKPETAEDRKS